MSTPGPLRPSAATGLNRLMQCAPPLLETTLDQLRTLILVRETGTALGAARLLGREQSSVQKQLDTLNRNFGELCGEALVHKQGRGKRMLFTDTGDALVEMARDTLGNWLDEIYEARRRCGGTLTVGTTRYTLGYLAQASQRLTEQFQRRGIELRIVHVRTKDLVARLADRQVDLVCGSVVTTSGPDAALADYDVLEWRRSGLSLLTNLPADANGSAIGVSELATLPLVVPSAGLITDFVRGWFGPDYRRRLDIVAEIDTAQYGFELLRSGLVRGYMLVTKGVGEAAHEGRLHTASVLRQVELVSDVEPRLELLVGVFTRRAERAAHVPDHPLNLLWEAFQDQSAAWRQA